jgi:hypothetical protein
MMPSKFPCPCCGFLVFGEPPGSYEICPICFWEDDLSQLRFPHATGANGLSLIDAQGNYASIGAAERRFVSNVREPNETELRDSDWRPIDQNVDNIEESVPDINYGSSYPRDRTHLYYWRESYWRLATSN